MEMTAKKRISWDQQKLQR